MNKEFTCKITLEDDLKYLIDVQEENESLHDAIIDLNEKRLTLESERDKLKEERAHLFQRLRELEGKCATLERDRDWLKEERDSAARAYFDLVGRIKGALDELPF